MSLLWDIVTAKWNPPKDTAPAQQIAGKTVVVTGANTGLGKEAALKFVQLGASKVILGSRSLSKGEAAAQWIADKSGRKDIVEVWSLDMLSYSSIQNFASRADKELPRLDIAVLNAGTIAREFTLSDYGWERILQVNTLSTTLLGLLLLPKLKASRSAHAEWTPVLELVSSGAHEMVSGLKQDPSTGSYLEYYSTPAHFSNFWQYGTSKLFLQYALKSMSDLARGEDGEPEVLLVSICPGPCKSELAREGVAWYERMVAWIMDTFIQRTGEEGARTYLSGVTLGKKGHGRFWQDDKIKEPAKLIKGEEGAKLQEKVWSELVEALKKDVPDVERLVSRQ